VLEFLVKEAENRAFKHDDVENWTFER
jgi:hypothetical protein